MANIIWSPQPKQAMLLACPAFERLYGGAAGGGKSDALLGDFLKGVNVYKKAHRGILFRQEIGELEELIMRAEELYLPLGARKKGTSFKPTFVFPNGAQIKFRHLEHDKDVQHYQGHQYNWIGFDELGNYLSDYAWTYMASRCRSPAGAFCQMAASANPGGVGHNWIKNRWIDGKEPYKIYDIDLGDGQTISRCFIPSTLDDNAILMRNDPKYESRLRMMSSDMFKAYRHGSWDVFAGQIFEEFNRMLHVVKPFPLKQGEWFKFCAMDWGYSHPYSIGWYAVNSQGRVVRYRESYGCLPGKVNVGTKESASSVAQNAMAISAADGVDTMVADPAVWGKVDPNDLSIAEKFMSAGWNMVKGHNDRLNGLMMCHEYLKQKDEDDRPMFLVFENCTQFIRTIPTLLPNPNRLEDVDTALEDHIYDEWRYALMSDFIRLPTRHLNRMNNAGRKPRVKTWDPMDN